ncbi:MAG: hypothetical protein AAF348_07575 [Bacteroidota bacterium]
MERKIIDSNGKTVKVGDKVRGEGFLRCNEGYKIDLSPIVTVRKKYGIIYFGNLSKSSFDKFYKV